MTIHNRLGTFCILLFALSASLFHAHCDDRQKKEIEVGTQRDSILAIDDSTKSTRAHDASCNRSYADILFDSVMNTCLSPNSSSLAEHQYCLAEAAHALRLRSKLLEDRIRSELLPEDRPNFDRSTAAWDEALARDSIFMHQIAKRDIGLGSDVGLMAAWATEWGGRVDLRVTQLADLLMLDEFLPTY